MSTKNSKYGEYRENKKSNQSKVRSDRRKKENNTSDTITNSLPTGAFDEVINKFDKPGVPDKPDEPGESNQLIQLNKSNQLKQIIDDDDDDYEKVNYTDDYFQQQEYIKPKNNYS